MTGNTILHYKILEKLGEGGMGVVYKALDTKLERSVAIKLLPANLLSSEDDRSRFNREAKAAAALSNPNIATVYEINEYDGKPFIVMEYIEGKTINDLLEKEMFKLKDVVSIAVQVAEGLKAAHSKNIVHRDIKSGNILFSKDGQAKILDFGLAKTAMSTKLTKVGSTIGTVAYMSPEQISGETVDHRTDLWSLGVVIFEMLTNRYPFAGDYDQAIFYNIINEPPDPLTAIRSGVPMSLEWIVNKLLAKDPDERYQNANDLIIDLKAVDIKSSGFTRVSQTTVRKETEHRATLQTSLKNDSQKNKFIKSVILVVSFLAVAILAGIISWNLHPETVKEVHKFQWSADYDNFIISPDGKKIAYSKNDKLWIRFLDKTDPVEIKNNKYISNVIWSPSSDYIAYFTGVGVTDDHQLRKVSVSGVGNVLITQTGSNYYPRFWGIDDSILVTTWDNKGANTLLKVPSSGGELKPIYEGKSSLSVINGNLSHVSDLPDGKSLLFSTNYDSTKNKIILQTDGDRKVLYSNSGEGFIDRFDYSNDGFILFPLKTPSGSDIWAIPFDASSLKKNGNVFLVARNADAPSTSKNGILSYRNFRGTNYGEQLILLSRTGQTLKQFNLSAISIWSPIVSPDGNKIACSIEEENGDYNIWIYDLIKTTSYQLTYDVPQTWGPTWSPDGKKIVFASGFDSSDIYEQEINSTTQSKSLIETENDDGNPYWSRNGRFILYSRKESKSKADNDLWYIDTNNGQSKKLFESRFNEDFPTMSPDGKFVAFQSDKSGQDEIWVTNFPQADKLWQVSFNGGNFPNWVGNEIFFTSPRRNELMVVKVKAGQEFEAPKKLFSIDTTGILLRGAGINYLKYAVTNDGQGIIAVKNLAGSEEVKFVLVENWSEEFKNKQK